MGQAVRQLAIDFDTAKCPEREALCNKYPRHKVEEAWHRAHWLAEWRKVCQPPRPAGLTELDLAQRIITEAKRVNGDDYRISIRTLQKWQRRYETIGPDGKIAGVEALIDQRGVLASAAKPDPARSPEAIAYFESIINCENKFSVKTAHVHTLVEARKQGWKWPEKSGNTRAWWGKRCNIADVSLNREGTDVWCRKHMPSLEVDWGLIEPGELFTADHHQCDFWVDYKDGQIRPWLTAVQDCRSRCIVGWNLGPSPNQEAILLAFRMSFGDWAIPENLRIDNGKDFKSAAIVGLTKNQIRELRTRYPKEWRRIVAHDRTIIDCDDVRWHGIAAELGIRLIFAEPYSPWSKGTLERWFGTFEDQCGKHFPTYCGNSTIHRPEALQLLRAGYVGREQKNLCLMDGALVPSLEQARKQVAEYLPYYHASEHRGRGVDGRTPLGVWKDATSLRRADVDALSFLIGIRGAFKVGRNGVSVTACGGSITYGRHSAALRRYVGRDVLVAVDPEFPAECFAFEVESRRMIGRLEPNELMHPLATSDDVREGLAEVKHDRKAMHDYTTKSARRTRTAIQRVNSHKYTELLGATGTDDAHPRVVNVEPVRTGFEGHSRPAQTEAPRTPRVPHVTLKDLARIADNPEPKPELSGPTAWGLLSKQYRESKGEAEDPYANLDLANIDLSEFMDDETECRDDDAPGTMDILDD